MHYRRNWIATAFVILGFVMFVPVAQAERLEIDGVACYSNTITVVQASPGEILVGSYDGKGIWRSTINPSQNTSFHQVGVFKGAGGKMSWNGFVRTLWPDGDFTIWETQGDSVSGQKAKLIYGTGRFKGATGEQTSTQITTTKPIAPGTEQACVKVLGWIESAK